MPPLATTKLRRMFRLVFRFYAFTGLLLAIVMWWSFTWPIAMSAAHATLAERMIGVLAIQPAALVSALVRFFLWAPSLLFWAFAPEQYAFGIWLAPGIFAARALGGQ